MIGPSLGQIKATPQIEVTTMGIVIWGFKCSEMGSVDD